MAAATAVAGIAVPVALYQVDHSSRVTGGGTFGSRKRCLLRWIFGLSNPQAMARGLRGSACRGVEHELILFWDQANAHFEVWCDGRPMDQDEIHCDRYTSKDRVEFYFELGHLSIKIGLEPMNSLKMNPFRRSIDATPPGKHELEVDGHRFSDLIRIYQLGMTERELFEDASRCARNQAEDRAAGEAHVVKRSQSCFVSTAHTAKKMLQSLWENPASKREMPAASTGHRTSPWETDRAQDLLLAEREQLMLERALRRSLKETRQPWWKTICRRLTPMRCAGLIVAALVTAGVVLVLVRGLQESVRLVQHLYATCLIFMVMTYAVPKMQKANEAPLTTQLL